jgi:hypothetical protein
MHGSAVYSYMKNCFHVLPYQTAAQGVQAFNNATVSTMTCIPADVWKVMPTSLLARTIGNLRDYSEVCYETSLLVPGDAGRLGTPIYTVTMETLRPVEARHTSCTQLLWKPCDPGTKGTPIYVVTVETSRCMQWRHTHLCSYPGNLKNVCVCVL